MNQNARREEPPSDTPKPALARRTVLLRRIAIAIAGLATVYLLGVNLLLNSGVLDGVINKRPEKTLVEWSSGWSLVPGRVHVNGLRIRGQSKKIQWQMTMESASVRISLARLFSRTLKVSSADGEGFAFWFRKRAATVEEGQALAGIVPDIEGLSNPPDPAPEVLYPPRPKKKRGWLLDLADLQFRGPTDLWFGQARLRGTGTIGGDLYYRLRETIQVSNATIALDDAVSSLGALTLSRGLRAEIQGGLSPFAPKETRGVDIFTHFTGSVSMIGGGGADLSVLSALLPDGGGLDFGDGEGRAELRLEVPTSASASGDLLIEATDAAILVAGREIKGDVRIQAVLAEGDLDEGRFTMGGSTLTFDNMMLPDPKRDRREEQGKELTELQQEPWWGHFRVTGGTVQLGFPLQMVADVEVEMRDSDPLIKLFFAKESEDGETIKIPGWVGALPNVVDVKGQAHIESGVDGLVIEDGMLAGSGEKFDALARLRMQGGTTVGQIYVHFGVLHVGVDMVDDGKKIKLSKPKRWYLDQPSYPTSTRKTSD